MSSFANNALLGARVGVRGWSQGMGSGDGVRVGVGIVSIVKHKAIPTLHCDDAATDFGCTCTDIQS